jgi:hypothetical protein
MLEWWDFEVKAEAWSSSSSYMSCEVSICVVYIYPQHMRTIDPSDWIQVVMVLSCSDRRAMPRWMQTVKNRSQALRTGVFHSQRDEDTNRRTRQ